MQIEPHTTFDELLLTGGDYKDLILSKYDSHYGILNISGIIQDYGYDQPRIHGVSCVLHISKLLHTGRHRSGREFLEVLHTDFLSLLNPARLMLMHIAGPLLIMLRTLQGLLVTDL